MKNQTPKKNNLKDLIINNPRAKERIAIKKIEREVACSENNQCGGKKLEYSGFLFY